MKELHPCRLYNKNIQTKSNNFLTMFGETLVFVKPGFSEFRSRFNKQFKILLKP